MDSTQPHEAFSRRPGDGWVECTCGSRHWGLHGAAGLLLARRTPSGTIDVVLQHRSLASHQGGTWGVPGGAVDPHESALEGALREAHEEAAIEPTDVEPFDELVLDHGPWRYTTILAWLAPGAPGFVYASDPESLEIRWVPADDVAALPLLPAFAAAWPSLRARLEA